MTEEARPSSQLRGVVQDPDPDEHVVHPAVVLQQVDPGQHPHEVADEERRDEPGEENSLPAAAVTGDEVRDRIGDEERERGCDQDVEERPYEDRLERRATREEALEDELERAGVPLERVPLGLRRLEDRIDGAERDAEDDVEREEEEEAEPEDAGQRQSGPERVPSLGITSHPR